MPVVYRTKDKLAAEKQYNEYVLPADPDAKLYEDDEGWWVIEAKAILGSEPKVFPKSK